MLRLTLVLEEHDHDGAVVLHSLLGQAPALVNDPPADDELQFVRLLADQLGDETDQVLARALYGDIAGLLATLQVLRAPQLEAGHAALLELVPGGQLVQSVLQQHLQSLQHTNNSSLDLLITPPRHST